MKDYDGINFDEMFQDNGNFEDFMKSMKEAIEKIEEASRSTIYDSISTSLGNYVIITGPNPAGGGHLTLITVERNDKKIAGPVEVQNYETREESKQGHIEWRKMIIDNPPIILKDIDNGEITQIPFFDKKE